VLFAAMVAPAFAAETVKLALGQGMPRIDHALAEARGGSVRIDSPGDEGLLVVFVSHACPEATSAAQAIAEPGAASRARLVRTILVNSNDPSASPADSAAALRDAAATSWPQLAYAVDEEGAVARAFGATSAPEAFLFDRRGRLVYHGAVAGADGRLQEALDSMLANEPVVVGETALSDCPLRLRE
jgi:hypothetical protein